MVRYWAHNPGTDNACASSTLAPANNTSGCRLIWLGHSEDRTKILFIYGCAAIGSRLVLGTRFVVSSSLTTHIKLTGGLSNWLARRPVKPLPAGHVGSSPTPPID